MTQTPGTNTESDQRVTERWAGAAHRAVDRAAATAGDAEQEVRNTAAKTAEKAREIREQTSERADEGLAKVRSLRRGQPVCERGSRVCRRRDSQRFASPTVSNR